MGPTQRITVADRTRFASMKAMGCIVALVYFGKPETKGEIHHLLSGGYRLGHHATICLAPWYHQGTPPLVRHAGELRQLTVDQATYRFGPSLALDRPAFEHRFGSELDLLAMQDELLATYDSCVREAVVA